MPPSTPRIYPDAVVSKALRQIAQGQVELARLATYTPDQLLTVVQVPTFQAQAVRWGNRWSFNTTVTLITSGPTPDVVLDELERLSDHLLGVTEIEGVRFSGVVCTVEPRQIDQLAPQGAFAAMATFDMVLRRGLRNG